MTTTVDPRYAAMARRIQHEMKMAAVPIRHATPTPPPVPDPRQRFIDKVGELLSRPENKGLVAGVEASGAVKLFVEPTPPRVPTADEIAAPKKRAAR